jgi:hypothetical protein
MALIIRIDVDRPYGRQPLWRHCLSRFSSDFYFPRIPSLGYLTELKTMLTWLNETQARSYVFFRRCTLPDAELFHLLDQGRHELGLHLEDSRSYETFRQELQSLEHYAGRPIQSFSKHGSGVGKFGFHHHPPYESEKYVDWANQSALRVFLGNLEDPTLPPVLAGATSGLTFYPSAFWLEPHWRDTTKFTVDWLLEHARERDIVMLVHPENVLADPGLIADFQKIIRTLDSVMLT